MEYSKLAQGTVASLGGVTPVILPFLPDFVEIDNFTAATTPTNGGIAKAIWYKDMGQGFAIEYIFNATPVLTTGTITSGGISTFSAGFNQFGPSLTVSSITKANPAVVTTSTNHNLVTGNVVVFQSIAATSTTGMQQLASIPFVITVTGATTFTIPFNTNQAVFTAVTAGTVKQVLYPALYYPGDQVITGTATAVSGTQTTITTSDPHNYVVGQSVAFRIPKAWGPVELNSPSQSPPYTANYFTVVSVGSLTTFNIAVPFANLTAFAVPTVAQVTAGLAPPQVVAVGDYNTGALATGTAFAPPTTINGPTIAGAFVNNTSQGFYIGGSIAGTAADVIYYRAYAHDLVN